MKIDVYKDTTPWNDEPSTNIWDKNFAEIDVPADVLMKWFYDYCYIKEDEEYGDFENWYKNVYTCDDTDGLYQYAKERGCNCWRIV